MPVDNLPPATDLVTGPPILDTPAIALNMPSAAPLITGSPILDTPTLHFVIAAPAATDLVPGSPVFGTPTAGQNPTHLTIGSPVFGTPSLGQSHHLTALDLVPASPQFGLGHFHEIIQAVIDGISLPENIEHNATGGPRFNTSIFIGANGFEQRSTNWVRQLGRWSINLGYREDTDPDFLAVLNAFYAVRGNSFGFLFRDWSDFSARDQPLALVPDSTGIYQLQKIYTAGVGSYARKITRPEAGTVVIRLAGVLQAATVNYKGGVISGIPSGCTASFRFLIPVRFDTDLLDIAVERGANPPEPGVVNVQSVDIVEIAE